MSSQNAWEGDLLDYESIGTAFVNLIKSVDTTKVISIEAGFGRGKTFFRRSWSEQLREAGETVIEVDVLQSDHSGDPVITLLGALIASLPEEDKGSGAKALESAKKIGALGARTLAKALLRSGAEEVIELVTDSTIDALGDFDALDGVVKEFGDGMSKAAGQMIVSQMAAERVRTIELPQQLAALRTALAKDAPSERIVVIIDELDRCHPEYALSFLEAMKVIFAQSGFVFCLMINAEYLERLAKHRFGVSSGDEKYLDKFVDIRLNLEPQKEPFKSAVFDLASQLPLEIPYGNTEDFSIAHAAQLASDLAETTGFSMRKIKRILLRVELALRCYSERPLDASLLVFLAFKEEAPNLDGQEFLPRSSVTPEKANEIMEDTKNSIYETSKDKHRRDQIRASFIHETAPELAKLPKDRYRLPEDKNFYEWALVLVYLAPHYIPDHQAVLRAVASVLVSDG